ncbi:fatty acid desaturase [Mycolicibacterium sp. CH28]|uniref:fatty acid desaturase family protein n=1 Tax=Mycolicibacterium sp. CH28 TaxID=2512237 RepID=UPI0010816858|nr:fatty acid desaturase [Mycolicibacterium sp. CH28]TGD84456.1 fatty acid desaturase [Mycolicibacterium sp. CH28]
MAITDVAEYAHLSRRDIDSLATALDAIRSEVEESRGQRDAAYIRRTIMFQRALDVGARLLIFGSRSRTGWGLGVAALAVAKSIENMEIAHNVVHGQWDWMNDPEIHSTTWEWDMAGLSSQWRYSHNYRHHVFTNVVDVDDDLGFGIMRVTRDVAWRPRNLMQPVRNALLAIIFEWGIALHGLHSEHERASSPAERSTQTQAFKAKIKRQVIKDYVLIPALNGPRWRRALTANAAANVLRNLWAYAVIFCGHFPDGAQTFTVDAIQQETKGDWYLRQMLGSANFTAGRVLAFLSGNLCYQIEHHLFPDLPSNRYAQIAKRVRALCASYGLPYTTGSLPRQFLQTQRTIVKLAFPDRRRVDAAPERAVPQRQG